MGFLVARCEWRVTEVNSLDSFFSKVNGCSCYVKMECNIYCDGVKQHKCSLASDGHAQEEKLVNKQSSLIFYV